MSDEIKIRHTCLRVRDLEKSVDFYTSLLGMELMRRRESPERGETVAYVGYGEESKNHALELVQEHEPPIQYSHGNTYGHIALLVPIRRRWLLRGGCLAHSRTVSARMLMLEGIRLVADRRVSRR